jgi:hypothetical protein
MNRGNRLNDNVDDANLIRVKLQSVGLYPGSVIVITPGKAFSKGRNIRRSTGTVNLNVTSTRRQLLTPIKRDSKLAT